MHTPPPLKCRRLLHELAAGIPTQLVSIVSATVGINREGTLICCAVSSRGTEASGFYLTWSTADLTVLPVDKPTIPKKIRLSRHKAN